MADITLKNLGDLPVVEPNESTHLLAEQDGVYARVPKDKVGGAVTWVDIAMSISGGKPVLTASCTGTEILDAMKNGIVMGRVNMGGTEMLVGPAMVGTCVDDSGSGNACPFFYTPTYVAEDGSVQKLH